MAHRNGSRARARAGWAAVAAVVLASLLVTVPLAAPVTAATGTPGTLDTSFSGDGKTTEGLGGEAADDAVVDVDGSVITIGGDFRVSRHLVDGTLDRSFGSDGVARPTVTDPGESFAVALDGERRVVVAGIDPNGGPLVLARFLPTGVPDPTFDGDGYVTASFGNDETAAYDVAVDPAGRIVIAGYARNESSTQHHFLVARFTDSGAKDASFGDGVGGVIHDLGNYSIAHGVGIDAFGNIVAAGSIGVEGSEEFAVTRYLPDGQVDTQFAGDGSYASVKLGAHARAVAVASTGEVFAAGPDAAREDYVVVKLDSGGVPAEGFGSAGVASIAVDAGGPTAFLRSIDIERDGDLVVAGEGNGNFTIARFTSAGSVDTTFDTDGIATVDFGATDSAASAVVGEHGITIAGGSTGFGLARLHGDRRAPATAAGRIYASDGADILATNEDGTGRRTVLGGTGVQSDPDVSPDGRSIVYARNDGTSSFGIGIADADGSNPRILYDSAGFDADAAFSPDGTRVAFASNQVRGGGDFDIWVVDVVTQEAFQVTDEGGREAFPDWTRDGRIVYESTRDGDLDVFVVDAVEIDPLGGPVPEQLIDSDGSDGFPQVSPNNREIAFVSNRTGSYQVHVLDRETNATRQITNRVGATSLTHTWAPEGDRLAVDSDLAGVDTLDIVRADGAAQSAITTGLSAPSWHANLLVRGDFADTTTSPLSVPVDSIGSFQTSAPSVQAAPDLDLDGLPDLDLDGLPDLDLDGLPDLDLDGLPDLDLDGLPDLDLDGLPDLDLDGLPDLDSLPSDVLDGLRRITEADLPITVPGGWAAINATDTNGTGADLSLLTEQQIDLVTLLLENPPGLAQLDQSNTDYRSSPIGRFSVVSVLLGGTELEHIGAPFDWCTRLEQLGKPNCGEAVGGLDASLVHLHLAGVPFDDPTHPINLEYVTMADVDVASDAPIRNVRVDLLQLDKTSFGGILVRTLSEPSAVVDCTNASVSCSGDTTLAQAQAAGAVRTGATFAALGGTTSPFTLLETITGVLTRRASPLGAVPLVDLGVPGYAGPGSQSVDYFVSYTVPDDEPVVDPTVTVDLPPTAAYDLGSGGVHVGPFVLREVAPGSDPAQREPVIDGNRLTFHVPGSHTPGTPIYVWFSAHPGLRTATTSIDVTVEAAHVREVALDRAQLRVGEVNEPNDGVGSATVITPDRLYVAQLGEPGDKDVYSLDLTDIPARSRVRVYLEHLGVAADIAAYHPANAPQTNPLRSGVTSTRNVLPLADDQPHLAGEPVAPDTNQEVLFLQADGLPLAGVSDKRGLEEEYLEILTTTNVGALTLAVVPDNGAFGPEPYSLRVTVDTAAPLPVCEPRTFPSGSSVDWSKAGSTTEVTPDTKTLFLVNRDRIADYYGSNGAQQVSEALEALIENERVHGAVVAVDSNDSVRKAYVEWDKNPCDPVLANDVVRAINAYVDSILPAGHNVQYVVPVGSDETGPPLPRQFDATQSYNEVSFANSLAFSGENNAMIGSLAAGYVFSDDAYGLPQVIPSGDHYQYLPTASLGRLVETPDDIALQALNFENFAGTLDAKTSFTTGYDFITDMAEEIDAAFGSDLGEANASELIGDFTKEEFLLAQDNGGAPASVQSLNAHFSQHTLVPSKGSERVTTADLQQLEKRLLYSVGCHSGFNVPDVLVAGTDPRAADWAQSVSSKGGIFAGQTGYGLGLPGVVALTEQKMSVFSQNLLAGLPVGHALREAKTQYYDEAGVYGVYDEKVRAESILYGLPMYSLFGDGTATMTSQATTAAAPEPTVTDPTTGLQSRLLDRSFEFTPGGTEDDRFFSINGDVLATHDRPVQPKHVAPVAPAEAGALHGVLTTAVTTTDATVNPLVANVAVGTAATSPNADPTAVAFPGKLAEVTTGPNGQHIVSLPGNFQGSAAPGAPLTGLQRLYPTMQQRLLFSDSDDWVAPAVESAHGYISNGVATFVVEAHDGGNADGVKQVLLLVRDESTTTRSVNLARTSGTTRWVGSLPVSGTDAEFIVQAVDGAGNVRTTTDKSYYYAAILAPDAPEGVTVKVTGTKAPQAPWYQGATSVGIDAGPGVEVEVSVDGAHFVQLDEQVTVAGDGVHVVDYRTAGGDTGIVVVPIDSTGPVATIISPTEGTEVTAGGDVPVLDFDCADATSGVASCKATIDGVAAEDGAKVPTGVGIHTIVVTAVDQAGHQRTASRTYHVNYAFEGFFEPVENDVVNVVNAGRKVPMKWRLRDANGLVRDLKVVKVIESWEVNCSNFELYIEIAVPDLLLDGLRYDLIDEQYVYTWQTEKLWKDKCREFRVKLDDGSIHTADFKFN